MLIKCKNSLISTLQQNRLIDVILSPLRHSGRSAFPLELTWLK